MPFVRHRRYAKGRNLLHNSQLSGAVAATPGTLPRGWIGYLPDSATGVASQVVALSIENGMRRLDWRLSGTASASVNGFSALLLGGNTPTAIKARVGDMFALSAYVRLVAGTLPPFITFGFDEYDAAGAWLGNQSVAIGPTAAALQRQRWKFVAELAQANVNNVSPLIRIGYTIGQAFDVTLGIAIPQLERGGGVTAPERRAA